jgi:hypothetical protein
VALDARRCVLFDGFVSRHQIHVAIPAGTHLQRRCLRPEWILNGVALHARKVVSVVYVIAVRLFVAGRARYRGDGRVLCEERLIRVTRVAFHALGRIYLNVSVKPVIELRMTHSAPRGEGLRRKDVDRIFVDYVACGALRPVAFCFHV